MKIVVSQLKGLRDSTFCLKVAGVALLAALTFTACASTPKTRYYTLRVPPPPSSPSPKTHFVLQVEHFEAPDVLRDSRIIYYTSPNELNFHQYHRWSSDPGELLSELTMKYLAETGLFRQVYAYPAPVTADYTLHGRVLELGAIEYKRGDQRKAGVARLGLKLDLLETRQNKVVWSTRLEQTAPIERKRIEGVVDALNSAAESLLQNAYRGISQVVEHEAGQKQEQGH